MFEWWQWRWWRQWWPNTNPIYTNEKNKFLMSPRIHDKVYTPHTTAIWPLKTHRFVVLPFLSSLFTIRFCFPIYFLFISRADHAKGLIFPCSFIVIWFDFNHWFFFVVVINIKADFFDLYRENHLNKLN